MEEFSQPFVDALNHLRNNDKGQIHPQAVNKMSEYSIAGAFGDTINPAITTSATTSTILSKVGMSGGSVTYTNLGKDKKNILVCLDNMTSYMKITYLMILKKKMP